MEPLRCCRRPQLRTRLRRARKPSRHTVCRGQRREPVRAPKNAVTVDSVAMDDRHSTGLVRRTSEDPCPLRSVIRLALADPVTLRPHLAMGLPFRLLARAESGCARLDGSVDTSVTATMPLPSRSCALFDARERVIVQIVCRLALRSENSSSVRLSIVDAYAPA
jgi:hypothetical protein